MTLTRKEIHARYEAKRPPRGEAYKEWKRQYQRRRVRENLLAAARYRARIGALEFGIDISDVVMTERCPYLGIELKPAQGSGARYASPTLDRIDNSKGYIKGNVEVISYRANALKRDLSLSEMKLMGSALLERGER